MPKNVYFLPHSCDSIDFLEIYSFCSFLPVQFFEIYYVFLCIDNSYGNQTEKFRQSKVYTIVNEAFLKLWQSQTCSLSSTVIYNHHLFTTETADEAKWINMSLPLYFVANKGNFFGKNRLCNACSFKTFQRTSILTVKTTVKTHSCDIQVQECNNTDK